MLASRTSNTIEKAGLFKCLDDPQKGKIASLLEFVTFQQGEVVLEKGVISKGLYIVVHGDLEAGAPDKDTGEWVSLQSTIAVGSVLGEISALTGGEATATVKATDTSVHSIVQCLLLPTEKLQAFLPLAPKLADELSNLANSRQRLTVNHGRVASGRNLIAAVEARQEVVTE